MTASAGSKRIVEAEIRIARGFGHRVEAGSSNAGSSFSDAPRPWNPWDQSQLHAIQGAMTGDETGETRNEPPQRESR